MSMHEIISTFANPNPQFFNHTSIPNAEFNGVYKIKLRVYAKTKGCDVKITSSKPFNTAYAQFSAPLKPIPPLTSASSSEKTKEDEEKQNYHLNIGYAIRSLREEFPELFDRDLTFDIYRDDIVFKDPRHIVTGIENYKSIFSALRFQGRIFFKDMWIDILRVWQPAQDVILVRWTVHGIARVPWDACSHFDGISEYKVDKNGKIYEHKVDNIALNSPTKFHMLSVEELIQSLGCPSTSKPTCFEFSSSSTKFLPLEASMRLLKHLLTFVIGYKERSTAETSEEP